MKKKNENPDEKKETNKQTKTSQSGEENSLGLQAGTLSIKLEFLLVQFLLGLKAALLVLADGGHANLLAKIWGKE